MSNAFGCDDSGNEMALDDDFFPLQEGKGYRGVLRPKGSERVVVFDAVEKKPSGSSSSTNIQVQQLPAPVIAYFRGVFSRIGVTL